MVDGGRAGGSVGPWEEVSIKREQKGFIEKSENLLEYILQEISQEVWI